MPPKRKPVSATTPVVVPNANNKRSAPEPDASNKRVVLDLTASDDVVAAALPPAAASSSSSSPPPEVSKYSGKFIFITELCHSYTLDELWTVYENTHALHEQDADKDIARAIDVLFPCGRTLKSRAFWFTNVSRRSGGLLPGFVANAPIDWARSSGQTECPLTTEKFEKPHILSVNGRSYSLDAFNEAVAKTLEQGEPLRLEDVTLSVLDLPDIKLYPNYSLPGWELPPTVINFEMSRVKSEKLRFSDARASEKNDPTIAALFDRPSVLDDNGLVSGKHIYRAYQARHNTVSRTVENLVVSKALFPRGHMKDAPHLRNVLFHTCYMVFDCCCGLKFVGCRFERCVIVVPNGYFRCSFSLCELVDCTFIFALSDGEIRTPRPGFSLVLPESVRDLLRGMNAVARKGCRIAFIQSTAIPANYTVTAPLTGLRDKIMEAQPAFYHLSDI